MDKLKLYGFQQIIQNEKNFKISECSIQLFDPTTILVTINKIEDTTVEKEFINYFINLCLKNNLALRIDCDCHGNGEGKRAKVIYSSNEEMATYTFIVSE